MHASLLTRMEEHLQLLGLSEKTNKCKDCKKEMIVISIMPRYGVLNNKAPPITNSVVRNLNPKRSAQKIFLR